MMADHNPTSVGSRSDALHMKERMAARHGASFDATVAPTAAAAQPVNTSTSSLSGADQQHPSVGDLDRCRSLKERIYDRNTRPLPPMEVTKDVYTHEVPFPVQTVYEMSRVHPTHPSVVAGSLPQHAAASPIENLHGGVGGGAGETLLLPNDAALLVRSLEDRLGVALQRNKVLEEDIETHILRTDTANTKQLTAEKLAAELSARNEELQKQLGAVRNECQDSLLDGSKKNEGLVAKALEESTGRWQNVEASLKGEIEKHEEENKALTTEKNQMTMLVKELKEQLLQNAQSLQTSTSTIRDLANELLSAKQQSSFISNGYKQIESQLKQANSLGHSQTAEISSLKTSVAALDEEREKRAKAEVDLKEAQETLQKYEPAEMERRRLSELTFKLEKEAGEKDRELMNLKQQVDMVRNQAATAYEHTNKFRAGGVDPLSTTLLGAPAPGPMYTGGLPPQQHMMPPPSAAGGGDDYGRIRHEIEEEERRYNDESRRWRQKDASHR